VVADIFGVSGRDMLAALVAGERNPKVLAQLARRSMRAKITVLEEAFTGHFTGHHAFLLATMLSRVDAISADIAVLDARITAEAAPFADAVARLDEIPGISLASAYVILAEIGTDMTRFPAAGHLASWARLAPGIKESAGKKKGKGTTGHGNLAAPSWSSPGTCSPTPPPDSATSAPATTPAASTPSAASAITSASSKPSATPSPSSPPPEPTRTTRTRLRRRSAGCCRAPANSPIFGLAVGRAFESRSERISAGKQVFSKLTSS